MGRTWAYAGIVAAGLVAAGMWLFSPSPEPPPLVESAAVGVDGRLITVHVSGAVAAPGLVAVPERSRVADAVVAAGGALVSANLSTINLAAPLSDGQQLVIPALGTVGEPAASDGRVRINAADASALEGLPGVGPVLAERIVAHRDANGPFAVVEDLLDVPGIGEGKLEGMRDAVLVP